MPGDMFTLGFVDMSVSCAMTNFYIKGIPNGHAMQNQLSKYALPWLEFAEEHNEVFFEVKTQVQSVKQIKFYKSIGLVSM